MKILIYSCDNCSEVLSDKSRGINKKHISIDFGAPSGWVTKEKRMWDFRVSVFGIHQFCNGKCLGEYFTRLKKNI